jgi:hypothetical protein
MNTHATTPHQDSQTPWIWKATFDTAPVAPEADDREPSTEWEERLRGLTQLPDC